MSDDEDAFGASAANIAAGYSRCMPPLPSVSPSQGPPSIPLSALLDYAVQRTYQDLTVLTELLPKKSDMERKISIIQYAHSTRQLFIRLLAVVKWAKSIRKVEMCTAISCFLDQQTSCYVETADRLFQLARETLPQARLNAFQIPAAVDVLVMGTYSRLPACIKTRFVPDEPLKPKEQACVLRRLNQIIQQRLVFSTVTLPEQMQNFSIRNGMVNFVVPGEFEARLTLLGEEPTVPWSLLNVKILVEDYAIGEGAELVHSWQVNYLHELVEARMFGSENPIAALYNVLHSFCLYLQLDVLFCQASKLVHERMMEHVCVEEYLYGQKLTLRYWWSNPIKKPNAAGDTRTVAPSQSFNYKLSISVVENDSKKSLAVTHIPSADGHLPTFDASQKLSIENLLSDTILMRIRHRLKQLQERLRKCTTGTKISGKVPTLEIPLLDTCVESEKLTIAINLFTGQFVCSISSLEDTKRMEELEKLLNCAMWQKLDEKLRSLKLLFLMERCRKSLFGFPVCSVESIPLLPSSTAFRSISSNRLLFRFLRFEGFYLIVEFLPNADSVQFQTRYFLLSTCSANAVNSVITAGVCEFLKPLTMLLLDPRNLFISQSSEHVNKIPRTDLKDFLPAIVTQCDQRIPFIILCEEMEKRKVKYQTVLNETVVGGHMLKVLGLADVAATEKPLVDALWSSVVSCSVRLMHDRGRLHWTLELITKSLPLIGSHQRQSCGSDGSLVTVLNGVVATDGAKKFVDDLLNSVYAFARIYDVVTKFAPIYQKTLHNICDVTSVISNRLVVRYGSSMSYLFMIQWRHQDSCFHVSFGTHYDGQMLNGCGSNPHSMMIHFIQAMFNEKYDLAYLVQYLNETVEPLAALQRLPQLPLLGLVDHPAQPVGYMHLFCVLPISATVVRVMYKLSLCFELTLLADGELMLRDCAAPSPSSPAKNPLQFSPIIAFKSFFALHERLVGAMTAATSAAFSSSMADNQKDNTGIGKRSPESPQKTTKSNSPLTTALPITSPGSAMIAPSPLGSVSSLPTQVAPSPASSMQWQASQSAGIHGPTTPSPANFSNLLSPSPASNAGMLMTPSPATFALQSPAPIVQNTQVPPSPGPEPSPLSFVKSFAEASAESADTSGNNTEFNAWGEFTSSVPATPIATAAPSIIDTSFATPLATQVPSSNVTEYSPENLPVDLAPTLEPFIITHGAWLSVCSRNDENGRSRLQNFLASVVTLDKFAKQNANTLLPSDTPGQICLQKVGALDMKICLDERNMSSLVLNITNASDGPEAWSDDDRHVIVQYFSEIVAPMHHHNAIVTFIRFLSYSRSVHHGAPKSLVAVMRHQLKPERNKPWSAALCLVMPPPHLVTPTFSSIGAQNVSPGMASIMVNRDQRKMLLWVKISRNANRKQSWIFPLLYDGEGNNLQLYPGQNPQAQNGASAQNPILADVNMILQRHNSSAGNFQNYMGECIIWPAINALIEQLPVTPS